MKLRTLWAMLLTLILTLSLGLTALAAGEAPMLKALVEAGKLPPVEERLPENPMVIEPVSEIGTYGGTWRHAYTGMGDTPAFDKMGHTGLVIYSMDGSEVIPGLAEKYEVSEDGMTYTFYLRKGLKWSDGVEYTADDVEFWYLHEVMNKDLNPGLVARFAVNDMPIEFTKIDDYTVQFVLPGPSAVFLENLAHYGDHGIPKHYLSQFHPEFVDPEELKARADQQGFDNWMMYFGDRNDIFSNMDRPTMRPWMLVSKLGDQVYTLERNPYFWQVDPEGNQLPYIDKIDNYLMSDPQTILMSVVAGEIDFMVRNVSFVDYPFLMENRERGNYEVYLWPMAVGSGWAFMPNMNHKDPVLREIFEDIRFRTALSIGINRDEINEMVYYGRGKPRAATVVPECPFWEEDLEDYAAEYDVARANALLDEMGLERGSDGIRRRPDGKRLEITLVTLDMQNYGSWVDIVEMSAADWEKLGIDIEIHVPDRALLEQRWAAGDFDIGGWAWGRGLTPLTAPKFVFPSDSLWNPGPLYGQWYESGGARGEEPLVGSDVRRAMELYGDYVSEPRPDERLRIGKELIRLSTESLWSIGTIGEIPSPIVVSNRLRNVPATILNEHILQTPTNARPQQFFFAD